MSIRRRLWKGFVWGVSLALAIVVGGAMAAYSYVADGENMADLIRRGAPRFVPGCQVKVLRAQLRPFVGEVKVSFLSAWKAGETGELPMAAAQYIQVRYDPWAMFKGRFEPREARVVKPVLRLRRLADGSWNFQGLLADPWPMPKGGPLPPIRIVDGTVELVGDGEPRTTLALLRDVAIEIPASPGGGAPVAFELTAKGELFDRVHVEGTVDPATGRVALSKGELVRGRLFEGLRGRLPAEAAGLLDQVGLSGGEVDATLATLTYDPAASPPLHYQARARLHGGLWKCPKLPFPISDVSADVEAVAGRPIVVSGSGSDGATSFGLRGKFEACDPARAGFEVRVEAQGLQLDRRLRDWTPPKYLDLWELYLPEVGKSRTTGAGRVNLVVRAARPGPGGKVEAEADVELIDVSMKYKHFPYPVVLTRGKIHATPRRMDLADIEAVVGGRPLRASGTVLEPGPLAVARLRFDAEALPVDDVLMKALPPDVRKVVLDFRPTGTVRGHADLVREPPARPGDDPMGRVRIDSVIDLGPGCSATWEGLKYPVMNLTGQLEIHPGHWIFRRMRGNNGQATITANGEVTEVRKGQLKIGLKLEADNLPFDQQLRDALVPKPWQLTWATLNPTGASDVAATIAIEPGRPDRNRIEITPRKQAGVTLRFNPLQAPGAPPVRPLEMRMDDVTGRFVFDTATVPPTTMTNVGFKFHMAPVRFARGQVDVKDNGAFALGVGNLEVADLRLDEDLRRMMPPVMAQLARRLDDRKLHMKANLGLGWSGKAGESAWCRWEDARVVLNDNKVDFGTDLALEHIQGELYPLRGRFDGRTVEVHGPLHLASVSIFGQQVTRLKADLDVGDGSAALDNIRGTVLGGALSGGLRASLDVTPRYSLVLAIEEADLHQYAMALTGHQTFKGLLSGMIDVGGIGSDPHTLTGWGKAEVVQGDLGHLPVALRFLNALKLAKDTKVAFDSAEVAFRINNGETAIEPVHFSGNAFSLHGRGTLDVRGDLDLRLRILAGRDAFHVPLFSDLTRELSGQFLQVRVLGPIGSPSFKPEALPSLLGKVPHNPRRLTRATRDVVADSPWRTGLEPRARTGLAARWWGPGD